MTEAPPLPNNPMAIFLPLLLAGYSRLQPKSPAQKKVWLHPSPSHRRHQTWCLALTKHCFSCDLRKSCSLKEDKLHTPASSLPSRLRKRNQCWFPPNLNHSGSGRRGTVSQERTSTAHSESIFKGEHSRTAAFSDLIASLHSSAPA